MPSRFTQKKAKILHGLHAPQGDGSDRSPKGSIDEGIRDLCNQINALDDYATTSSCAGRISVFLDGPADTRAVSSGGKGGGRWLYISHQSLDLATLSRNGSTLTTLFGLETTPNPCNPPTSPRPRFVHFKFEPMILHVLAATPKSAQRILSAALSAGFRESGSSCVTGDDSTPMIAVRTNGLALESIIAFHDPATGKVFPMVSEGYLNTLVLLANERFDANAARVLRFSEALLAPTGLGSTSCDAGAGNSQWEPGDLRAQRKRAEGLRRAKECQEETKRNTDDVEHALDAELLWNS